MMKWIALPAALGLALIGVFALRGRRIPGPVEKAQISSAAPDHASRSAAPERRPVRKTESRTVESRSEFSRLRSEVRGGRKDLSRPALVRLSDMGTPEAINLLIQVMTSREDLGLSADAAMALARTPKTATVRALRTVAGGPASSAVRLSGLQAMRAMVQWWAKEPPDAEASDAVAAARAFLLAEGRAIAREIVREGATPVLRRAARSFAEAR